MHTLIISEVNKAQFVYLFFYRRESDFENEKIIICRWTVMLKSNLESFNLYFYHTCYVTSYFGYVFK